MEASGDLDLHGKTIVLPAVTIGNIGQLAVDLLVNTVGLPCAAALLEPSLLPCVGLGAYDAEGAGTLSTELQVYADAAQHWAALQQRSPPATGRQQDFAEHMADFLAAARVRQVLMLASADAALRGDGQLATPGVRFCASGDAAGAAAAHELGFRELEGGAGGEGSALPPWPLWRALEARGVPALLLVWHASEGDNTEDARTLATAAARTLEKLHGGSAEGRPSGTGGGQAWAMPRSWGTALYGTPRVAY